jgi:hypothetical protein
LLSRTEGSLITTNNVFGLCFYVDWGILLASTAKCVCKGTGHSAGTQFKLMLSPTVNALAFAMLSDKTNKYIQFELVLVTEAIGSCLIKQKASHPHLGSSMCLPAFSPESYDDVV